MRNLSFTRMEYCPLRSPSGLQGDCREGPKGRVGSQLRSDTGAYGELA